MRVVFKVLFLFFTIFFLSEKCVFGVIDSSKRGVGKTTSALIYLAKYGYVDPSINNPKSGALITRDSIRGAILGFQAMANIPQTGVLDDQTITMMSMKRCGNVDVVGRGSTAKRKKRYALQGSRWRVKELSYIVTKYPLDLLKAEVDRDIRKAFQVWTTVTDLKFVEAAEDATKKHIEIRFETSEHGDGDPFDGPGGTLAHAYFPIYGGDAHFDASETWTVQSFKGTNLFQVAVHEFGHSLGLSHSDRQSALMAPFYRGYQPTFRLDDDDITAIQALYGKKTEKDPSVSSPPSGTEPDTPKSGDDDPILCSDPKVKIDAIVKMKGQGEKDVVHLFKGQNYWKLTDDGIANGYPRDITADFEGLPGDIDSAFAWNKGRVYFFKGSEYWRFTHKIMDSGYPKNISTGFRGIPNDVKSAVVWSGNGKIYFFKGDNYWRFDPAQSPNVMRDYPRSVSNWEGLPNGIDDALQYTNGYTYFFKDGQYWRFNDRAFKVDSADPPFPRPIGYWWLGCKKSSQFVKAMQGDGRKIIPIVGADDVTDAADAVRDFFRRLIG